MAYRRIPLSALRVGMYVAKLDRRWFLSPFLCHSFRVKSADQIDKLRRFGIKEIEIDPTKGLDLADDPCPAETAPPGVPAESEGTQGREKGPLPAVPSLHTLHRDLTFAREARKRLEGAIRSTFSTIATTGVIQPGEAKWLTIEVTAIAQTLPRSALFMAFSQDRGEDPLFSQHALTVSGLSMILGHAAGLDLATLQDVVTGALLHDTGLLHLPADLRRRCQETSSHLSLRQQELYRSHPRLAAMALERQGGFSPSISQLVADHHALLNNTGFPKETPGAFTTDVTRVVMAVDRYDELITGFGGASPLTPHQALQRLYADAQTGKYDARYVALFVTLLGVYPVYSGVKLNTGERGIVTAINAGKAHQPVVTITHGADGRPYPVFPVIDLAYQETGAPIRSIAGMGEDQSHFLETFEYSAQA